MKDLARRFLSEEEKKQIEAAVSQAEKKTSGEIVCLIQSASYHYPMAQVLGGTAMALPAALALTPYIGGRLWLGTQNMWLFVSIFCLLFAIFYLLVKHTPPLKRWFISQREIDEEVEEAAVTSFFRHGLYRTRDATGVLIFISVFEHKVWVLADHGINAKVPEGQWDTIVAAIKDGIKAGQPAQAICQAVESAGRTLAEHFPVRPDDTDELDNLILEG